MPTYEFRCPDGTIVERMFKMSEVPDSIPSPNGDGEAVRLISGGAGLLFKGDGFYITDYGKDGKKDQRKAASTAAESSAGSSEKATTTAPSGDGGASSPTPPPPKPPTDTKAA
jgi:predicted nucleic acid-binding Zn ribbon protein